MNPKTAAKWVEAHEHCQKTRAPAVLAKVAEGKYKTAIRVLMDSKREPKIRTPRGVKIKTAQAAKKDLHWECELLCKALVFHRDCGDWRSRSGSCITCGHHSEALQWGHFIKRQRAPGLLYSVAATGGQCGGCNGFGDGEPLKYAEAIDRRDGAGTAKALENAFYKTRWAWNKTSLSRVREYLAEMCRSRGIIPGVVLAAKPEETPTPSPLKDTP